MKTIFVVCINNVPTRCFNTEKEAFAWTNKMTSWGKKSEDFSIHSTLYYLK